MDTKSCSSISLHPVHVKDEPEHVESVFNEQVHVKNEVLVEVEHIKEEIEWEDEDSTDSYGVSEAPSDLYIGHEGKDELMLGSESLQPPNVAFTLHGGQAFAIKKEPILKDCVVMLERTDDLEALLASRGTVGRGTVGRGTVGRGTVGRGTAGRGTAGRGTAGRGTAGRGTGGRGTEGRGTAGQGTAGQGTAGRGTVDRGMEDRGTEGRWTEGWGTEQWTDSLVEGRMAKCTRKESDLGSETHRNIKSVRKIYVCAICKLKFNLRAKLMEHVMVHIHQSTDQESCDADEEEEIDVVSLGPPLKLDPCPLRGEEGHTQRSWHTGDKHLVTTATGTTHDYSTVARSSLRTRYTRSNTSDSEPEAPKPERCQTIHNHKERIRRSQLSQLFNKLKEQIPATKNKYRTTKIFILEEAVSLCRRLQEEQKILEEQRRTLLFKFKKLRKKVVVSVIL